MKSKIMKKISAWLLITTVTLSTSLSAVKEGIVVDDKEFPMLQLIQNLDQVETPLSQKAQEKLYDIGQMFSLISQKDRMDDAKDQLDAFDQLESPPEFHALINAINEYHAFLDEAHQDGIPQTEDALYYALRNREYADRFGLPFIGAAGLGAGYGSAVVRSRMMTRFIELLGLSALGYAGTKLEQAAIYAFVGIIVTACLGSILYHWRKYNKLYLEKQKEKLTKKITTKHDKKIKELEQKQLKELEEITKQQKKASSNLANLSKDVTKQLTQIKKNQGNSEAKLTEYKQNVAGQIQTTQANQNTIQEQYGQLITTQNLLIEALNNAWGAIALANIQGTQTINQNQLAQFRAAGTQALLLYDKQIKENNKRRNKIFNKLTFRKNKNKKPSSPLLPLTPRHRSSSLGMPPASSSMPTHLIASENNNNNT